MPLKDYPGYGIADYNGELWLVRCGVCPEGAMVPCGADLCCATETRRVPFHEMTDADLIRFDTAFRRPKEIAHAAE